MYQNAEDYCLRLVHVSTQKMTLLTHGTRLLQDPQWSMKINFNDTRQDTSSM